MNGSTPAYRNLSATDLTGPDVYELNKNLVDLGYDPDGIIVDDTWQTATTAGIDALQYHLGETETGSLTLGQVVFLPGQQMIQAVDTTVGSTSYTPAAGTADTEFVDFSMDSGTTTTDTGTSTNTTTGTTTTGTTPTTSTPSTTATSTTPKSSTGGSDNLSRQTLQALLRLVHEQQAELRAARHPSHSSTTPHHSSTTPSHGSTTPHHSSTTPHHSSTTPSHSSTTPHHSSTTPSHTGNPGGGSGPAVAVLSTSSTKLVVTVDLGASVQSEASIGEHVTVEMPNGSTQNGKVTAVSPVAQSSSSGDSGSGGSSGSGTGSSTVPVTVELNRPAKGGGLDQASVSVNFVQSKAKHVLSIPVTALLATSGSTFAVQEAASPHKLIPVRTGLFAAGYVAISGSGIYPGLQITDSQG
jgi:hypothetical protein